MVCLLSCVRSHWLDIQYEQTVVRNSVLNTAVLDLDAMSTANFKKVIDGKEHFFFDGLIAFKFHRLTCHATGQLPILRMSTRHSKQV
jgi:nicotinamide riboside kinase